jgi:hypothetical protein
MPAWLYGHGYIDMARQSVKGRKVELQNIGGFPAPLDVIVTFSEGSKETFHQTPAIWEKNINTATVTIPGQKKITSVTIDGGIFMDADPSNNTWK